MNIVACLKQTLDPEILPKDFRVDPATKTPVQGHAKLVMDSYSENALELALQLRERYGGTVTAITLGDRPADDVLRRALSMTADRAIRVWDPSFSDLDARSVAHILARSIESCGGADVVLTGRQAADFERGSVGPMLAEELGAGCVAFVMQAEVSDGSLRLRREIDGGTAVVGAKLPVVLTVTSHQSNSPRLPKVKDTMMAMRKPIEVKLAADLNLAADRLAPTVTLSDLFVPTTESHCELITGDDGDSLAGNLLTKLRDLKVL